jgi:hypothetical protein
VHSTQLCKICIARSADASRYLLLVAAALFVRDILCRRIESAYLADLLRFESNPYPRMDFYHRTNYGQNEPANKAILILNEYCGLFGFRDDESVCFPLWLQSRSAWRAVSSIVIAIIYLTYHQRPYQWRFVFLFVNYFFSKIIIC